MCSLVLIGWKPTKGTCIDIRRPMIKKVVYAAKIEKKSMMTLGSTVSFFSKLNNKRFVV